MSDHSDTSTSTVVNLDPLFNVIFRAARDPPFPNSLAPHEFTRKESPKHDPFNGRMHRFIPVLDAIASVCVSKAEGQTIAISLTLLNDKTVLLCLAQNDDVEDKTMVFLSKLWDRLKEFSKREQKARGKTDKVSAEENSPDPVHNDEIQEIITNISLMCCEYGYKKLRQRIQKYWKDFSKLLAMWRRAPNGPANICQKFEELATTIELIRDQLNLKKPDFSLLFHAMATAQEAFDILSTAKMNLMVWMHNYTLENVPNNPRFDLSRYLGKIFSLYRSIVKLCVFALSPRLAPVLDRDLVIQRISPDRRDIIVPLTDDDWTEYIKQIFVAAGIEDRTESETILAEEVQLALKTSVPKNPAPVHCECLLLVHHHRLLNTATNPKSEAAVPPLNYIGCSKLSCYGCTQYFNAYNTPSENKTYRTHFYTQGSHSKVYQRWAMPVLDDEDADSYVRRQFCRLLCKDHADSMVASKGVARRGSDSTMPSASSVERSIVSNNATVASNLYPALRPPSISRFSAQHAVGPPAVSSVPTQTQTDIGDVDSGCTGWAWEKLCGLRRLLHR